MPGAIENKTTPVSGIVSITINTVAGDPVIFCGVAKLLTIA